MCLCDGVTSFSSRDPYGIHEKDSELTESWWMSGTKFISSSFGLPPESQAGILSARARFLRAAQQALSGRRSAYHASPQLNRCVRNDPPLRNFGADAGEIVGLFDCKRLPWRASCPKNCCG